MARSLTSRFGTYRLAQYEKKSGKGVMDLIDIGDFEVSKLALLIKLGSPDIPMDDEQRAYEKLDTYLAASDENSIVTAYFDLLTDLNRDLKLFPGMNLGVLKDKMTTELSKVQESLEGRFDRDESNVIQINKDAGNSVENESLQGSEVNNSPVSEANV